MFFSAPKAADLPRLSPADEARPYSEFYYRGACTPAAETLKLLEQPMDPALALPADQVGRMLDPGYLERETGWCILPDGTGYSAVLTKMPNVTEEANNWWGPWHEQDDLRYKCWFPGSHQKVGPRWCQEDVGCGLEDVFFMQRLTPEVVGFDPARYAASPDLVIVRGQCGYSVPASCTPEDRPMAITVMHMIRRLPEGGVEYRTRFWSGVWFVNGRPVRMLPEGARVSEERAYGMAYHGACEMATLASILPELYARFGPGGK